MIKRLLEKLEAAMAAVAFAEEGDADTARRIMADAGMGDTPGPHPKHDDTPSGFRPRLASGS